MALETEQIIRESIEDAGLVESADSEALDTADSGLDASEATSDASTESETSEQSAEPTVPDAQAAPEPDALLKDFSKKRNNRIPYARVEKIVAKAREEAKAAAAAELQALQERYSRYESPDFANLLESLRVANENPEAFLDALSQADQRYATLLQARREAAQQAHATSRTDSIGPDVTFPDGSTGYSPEAFDRLLQSRIKAAEDALEQRFAQRFGPIEDSWRQAQVRQQAVSRVQSQIADAETWPGFSENKEAIVDALKSDRSLSLDGAYRKVVFGKLTASKDEVRKQVLAEINAKPKASQARVSSGAAPTHSGPQDTTDVIKSALREKGLL